MENDKCSFQLEIEEFALFLKCFKKSINNLMFSCTQNKVVVGGISDRQNISMFVHTVPYEFFSEVGRFDVKIPIDKILELFNIYRNYQKKDEQIQEQVYINLTYNQLNRKYWITFTENKSNKSAKYEVKMALHGIELNKNFGVDIQQSQLPNFIKKMNCPTKIVSDILSNMSENHDDISLTCTKSSLVIENVDYYGAVLDDTIISNVDKDVSINLSIVDLILILDTSKSKFIDMYFTGDNLIAFSCQRDMYMYMYFLQKS